MQDSRRDTKPRAYRLQQLCRSLSLNSMVFILGIDSRKNRTTEKLFHWLFLGESGNAHLSSLSLSLDYEEVAWVVTPTQVHVFLGCACGWKADTQAMHEKLMEACVSWPGVQIEHLAPSEFEDSEAAEDTKMLWFTRLMGSLEGPTGLCGGSEIETWPLVQAYALDFFGLSFFSMKHSPVDITSAVEDVFHEFDECLLQMLKLEHVPRLVRSLEQTREAVNKRNYVMGRKELVSATLAEFLNIPYEYALLQTEHVCSRKPLAQFFPADGKLHAAKHAVVRAVCGQTNLLCSRSWFFIPHKGLRALLSKTDLPTLAVMDYYRAIASSLRAVLPTFTTSTQAQEQFLHKLLQSHVFRTSPWLLDSARYHCSLVLFSIDADGIEQQFDPARFVTHTALVTAEQVKTEDGDVLGVLEFGESFCTGTFCLLTESVPVMGVWDKREEGGWAVDYGARIAAYENFTLFFEDLEQQGSLWVYKPTFVFVSQACGRIDIAYEDLKQWVAFPGNYLQCTERCEFTVKANTACLNLLESTSGKPIPKSQEQFRPANSPQETSAAEAPQPAKRGPELVVITGTPGSGKSTLADQLCKLFAVPCVKPQPHEQAYFNDTYYAHAITAAQAPLVVVVLPGYCPAQRIQPLGNVVSVIIKMHTDLLLKPDARGWQPMLRELVEEAHVAILEEQSELSAVFKRYLRRVNPDLSIYYVKAMLAPSLLRAVWDVRKPLRPLVPERPLVSLQSLYINCPLVLKKQKLEENLRLLQPSDTADIKQRVAPAMHIWQIKGTLRISGIGKAAFAPCKVSGPPGALNYRPGTEDCVGVLIVGMHLDPSRLSTALLNCRALAEKVPLRTKESLTAEELDLLSQGLETPEGYFFDGYHYINADGEKTRKHPLLDSRITAFLEEENERIGDFNRKLQKETASLQRSNTDLRVYSIFQY